MSENQFRSSKRQEAAKRLADDLSQLDVASGSGTTEDEEMLALIIEEASQGIDIAKRYPAFYRRLLNFPDLRQAFLEILESIEEEDGAPAIPWADKEELDFSFLAVPASWPEITKRGDNWSIRWQRTLDTLQTIFSPPDLAYRADAIFSEELWFTLLREEIAMEDLRYTVALECTFSEENEGALTPFLNIAVMVETRTKLPAFPLQTSLQWGTYKQTIQISGEGRAKFPDIPINTIYDEEHRKIIAELNLTLEPFP